MVYSYIRFFSVIITNTTHQGVFPSTKARIKEYKQSQGVLSKQGGF